MSRLGVRSLAVEAFAKVNVGWRVLGRRPDGYHEVQGCLQTISLHDTLEMSVEEAGEGVVLLSPDDPSLETPHNLVLRAARALARVVDAPPTRIVLRKRIPVRAGLGGGSADAAAALVGLDLLWRARRRPSELVELGAEVSSDVPALLCGGLVAVAGRGEVVRRIGSFEGGAVVLGLSGEGLSSTEVYEHFDRVGAAGGEEVWRNDLEPAACELAPGLFSRLERMRSECGVAFVSGSGPTVAGVLDDEVLARQAAERLRAVFDGVELARPVGWGVRVRLGS